MRHGRRWACRWAGTGPAGCQQGAMNRGGSATAATAAPANQGASLEATDQSQSRTAQCSGECAPTPTATLTSTSRESLPSIACAACFFSCHTCSSVAPANIRSCTLECAARQPTRATEARLLLNPRNSGHVGRVYLDLGADRPLSHGDIEIDGDARQLGRSALRPSVHRVPCLRTLKGVSASRVK